jgi:Arc/MetJ-type ribon-helix-helix transcriptional regulator
MSTITISLPDQIAQKIDTEAKIKGFSTRSEFIRSLLRKYFAGEEVKFEVFEPLPINEMRFELAKTGKYSQEFIDSVVEGLKKSSVYAS